MADAALTQKKISEIAAETQASIEVNRRKAVYRNRLRREKESYEKALNNVNAEIANVDIFSPEYDALLQQKQNLEEAIDRTIALMQDVDFNFNLRGTQIARSVDSFLRKGGDTVKNVNKILDTFKIKSVGKIASGARFAALLSNPIFWIFVVLILTIVLLIVIKTVHDNPTEAITNFCSDNPNCLNDIRRATDGSLFQRTN